MQIACYIKYNKTREKKMNHQEERQGSKVKYK